MGLPLAENGIFLSLTAQRVAGNRCNPQQIRTARDFYYSRCPLVSLEPPFYFSWIRHFDTPVVQSHFAC